MAKFFKLKSSDGELFEVDVKVANLSDVIKTWLEDSRATKNVDEAIPLPTISSEFLNLVIEWAERHKNDPLEFEAEDGLDLYSGCLGSSEWDRVFLDKIDCTIIAAMLNVSYILGVKGLMRLLCEHMANMMKRSNVEEIREMCGVVNDFTPEEEDRMREERDDVDLSWVDYCV